MTLTATWPDRPLTGCSAAVAAILRHNGDWPATAIEAAILPRAASTKRCSRQELARRRQPAAAARSDTCG